MFKYKKYREYLGKINVIEFIPEQVYLFKDSPKERRKFMDKELSKLDKNYLENLLVYNKLLKQRNELLKTSASYKEKLFEILDDKMSELQCYIIEKRKWLLCELYRYLSELNEEFQITLEYDSFIKNVTKEEILKHLNKKVSVEIIKPSGRYISVDQALEIINKNIKGIYVVSDSKRSYPYQNILAPIIGVVGSDNQGITGIEYIYDSYLKGGSGGLNIYTDAHGNLINDLTSYYDSAISGADVYLTIDLEIQLILERLLDNAFVKYNYDYGSSNSRRYDI